jgi:hypothetical protein
MLLEASVTSSRQVEHSRMIRRFLPSRSQPLLLALYEVESFFGNQRCRTHRSYSSFVTLAKAVRRDHPKLPDIPFPSKRSLVANQDSVIDMGPEVIEERARALDRWMREITNLLQCRDLNLLCFLLPGYLARRLHAGDVDLGDLREARTGRASSAPARLETKTECPSIGSVPDLLEPLELLSDSEEEERYATELCRPAYSKVIRRLADAVTTCPRLVAEPVAECLLSRLPVEDEAMRFVDCICSQTILKTCTVLAASIYAERKAGAICSMIVRDGIMWELVLLSLLVISAKQWESDAPIYTGDFLDAALSWPSLGAADVQSQVMSAAELSVLRSLDYKTMVSRNEFVNVCLQTATETDEKRGRGSKELGGAVASAA